MRRIIALVAVGSVALLGCQKSAEPIRSAVVQTTSTTYTLPSTTTTAPCQEDQPCWDCDTMGNGLCGKDDPTPFVPDVCAIQPDGSIQRWYDPVGVTGTITDCPA